MPIDVLNVGRHTEDDCRPEDAHLVVYMPLCPEAAVYRAGKLWGLRPLSMRMGLAENDGSTVPRFAKITDPAVISKLTAIKHELYGSPEKSAG